MLLEANLPQNCGMKHLAQITTYRIIYLQNLPNDRTPYVSWMKRGSNLHYLRVFDYNVDEGAEQEILVGYDNLSKGYIIYTEYRRWKSNACQNNQVHRD